MLLTEQSNPNTRNIDHRSTVGILKSINNEDARVVAGSTRLKAGTAQKMVLNMISTATMIRLGNVYSNLMVNLNLSNRKLTTRGIQIVAEAAKTSLQEAEKALKETGDVRSAIVMIALNARQMKPAAWCRSQPDSTRS